MSANHNTLNGRTFNVYDRVVFDGDNIHGEVFRISTDSDGEQIVRIMWDDNISSPWWSSNDDRLSLEVDS